MILLSVPTLTPSTHEYLSQQQELIDNLSYEQGVAEGKALWDRKESTKKGQAAFKEIKEALERMSCCGRRCHYCEDSYADEIEHFRPKDLYPEKVFVWDNYLYTCGPCNGPKSNKFAIIDFTCVPPTIKDVTRSRNATVIPPLPGDPALINPRIENPLDFLHLDLSGTFYFTPVTLPPDALRIRRAAYTIEVLHLNDRPGLIDMRKQAYENYVNRLALYNFYKILNPNDPTLEERRCGLGNLSHRAVWESMKLQHKAIKELQSLFELAPEALSI